jgi:UDPglucose 6-dehydrogenase
MNISVVGTGYVGLVSGVCFAEVGHHVTCIDIDTTKIENLKKGISPIYEPGIEELITNNLSKGNLTFTDDISEGLAHAEVILIAVGTPSLSDGRADLSYVQSVAKQIASVISSYTVIVTKSTVPVGTNDWIKDVIKQNLVHSCEFDVVSNPEFLREGSAIHDTFNADRVVIGSDNERSAAIVESVYEPFNIPITHTDIRSSEMIKYASNAFLATKISFINEIANICEKVGANVEDVALGMGKDSRIGEKFLSAGIGYGGSCFPKDTQALVQIASNMEYDFDLLKSVISVNNNQQSKLVDKAIEYYGKLKNKKIAILGLAFKPNTDDMREAASIKIIERLLELQCVITAYDPIAVNNARKILGEGGITYCSSYRQALEDADFAILVTEWDEFKQIDLTEMKSLLKDPVVFDGRNCFTLKEMEQHGYTYFSVGRPPVSCRVKAAN